MRNASIGVRGVSIVGTCGKQTTSRYMLPVAMFGSGGRATAERKA